MRLLYGVLQHRWREKTGAERFTIVPSINPIGLPCLQKVTLELPESVFSILRVSPEEFANELRLVAAVKWYELEKISQSKAAELAGLSRQAFVDALGRFEISPFQTSVEELKEELNRG